MSFTRVYLINNTNGIINKLTNKDIELTAEIKTCSSWQALNVKDMYNLSDSHYFFIRKKCFLKRELPSLTKIKNTRKNINNLFEINTTYHGVSNTILPKLQKCITPIIRRLNLQPSQTIRLRLAGDGTQVGHNLKLLNFTFTCLNDIERCVGPSGNFTIGIWEINDENYDYLKVCLELIISQIESIKEIEVDGKMYKLQTLFGGDMKFLLNVYGLGAANSENCCLWCKVPKSRFDESNLQTSITDVKKNARSLNEAFKTNGEKNKDGYKRPPLTGVSFQNAVVDLLHMWLRITDKLTSLFFNDVCLAGINYRILEKYCFI